jgi:thiamine-phosphate pyrophosphorylase
MKSPSSWDVCLVTDRAFSKGRSTVEIVQAAVKGGVSVVQLREKDLETKAFYQEGLRIREFLRSAGIPLLINDRIDVALALDADGVHLGRSDMPPDVARDLMGRGRIIGVSVNEPSHITEQSASYADYLAVSPLFVTSTKQDITKPWGFDGLRTARDLTRLPLVAIGSINLDNVRQVIEAGADCVAVITAITAADDPEVATRLLVEGVQAGKAALHNP